MIVGVVEHDRGRINELSLQMLTLGRRLAEGLNAPLHAVMVGADAAGGTGFASVAEELGRYGVSEIHLAEHPGLEDYAPEAWAQCAVEVMGSGPAQAVLAAGTDRGNEVMAHVAARTDLPMAANCTGVEPGEPFRVTRLRWGGSLLEEAELIGETKLLTVAPHAIPAEAGRMAFASTETGGAAVHTFTPTLADRDLRVRVVERVEPDRSTISLADAKVVVGGGRGVGSAEGFAVLEELAALLGGAVGCSRAVTSLGWRPHSDQVGQTGTRIAPDVYIACGISGAIQHMVGCKSAKCLVAINKDGDAPIVAQADYAIVGDLQQVLPALRDAVRSARRGP